VGLGVGVGAEETITAVLISFGDGEGETSAEGFWDRIKLREKIPILRTMRMMRIILI
jgi:hypothetical protein